MPNIPPPSPHEMRDSFSDFFDNLHHHIADRFDGNYPDYPTAFVHAVSFLGDPCAYDLARCLPMLNPDPITPEQCLANARKYSAHAPGDDCAYIIYATIADGNINVQTYTLD